MLSMVYVFALLAFIAGLLMIVGGIRKWPWLIDPPDRAVFYHPMPFVSIFFPRKWLPGVAVAIGVLWIATGVFVIYATSRASPSAPCESAPSPAGSSEASQHPERLDGSDARSQARDLRACRE